MWYINQPQKDCLAIVLCIKLCFAKNHKLIHNANSKKILQKRKKLKKYAKLFDTAGGGDII